MSGANQMTKTASIRFKAKLFRPAESEKGDSWTFLILPKNASAKFPSRGITAIEGTINGFPFEATLQPDGQKSHWLKVDRKLSEAARAEAGDIVTHLRQKNRNLRCRQICTKLPLPRRRENCGRTSRPSRAEIGSNGPPQPNNQRLAPAGSRMPARCSRAGSDAFAASTGLGCTVKA
jgi:Domain of unknown function (DUF1905)